MQGTITDLPRYLVRTCMTKKHKKKYPPSKTMRKTLKCGAKQIVGRLLMLPTIIRSLISQEAPNQATSIMVIASSCNCVSYKKLKLPSNLHQF